MREIIEKIKAHDVAGRPDIRTGDRVYFEREVRSFTDFSRTERELIRSLKGINDCEDREEKDRRIVRLAIFFGKKIADEVIGGYKPEKFDVTGIPRAGAYMQQFMIKSLLNGINIDVLCHSLFVSNFEEHSNGFLHDNTYGMRTIVRGAKNVAECYNRFSDDENIIFVGISIYLDTRHHIDLLIARKNGTGLSIDEVDLYEIKSSQIDDEDVDKIHRAHIEYINGNKRIILNGLGTTENRKHIEHIYKISTEEIPELIEYRISFVNDFLLTLKEHGRLNNFEDILSISEHMSMDPILCLIRIRNITDATLIALTREERDFLLKIQKAIINISVPVEKLGLYRRLTQHDTAYHIDDTLKWNSIIAYKKPDGNWHEDRLEIKEV